MWIPASMPEAVEPEAMSDTRIREAAALMADFARRTGLEPGGPPRRYLWTDAFAVCNYLALERATGDERYGELASRLVEQVHHVLGRHREDDARSGWISGLGDQEGEAHPTRGGLRIGKELPERGPGDSMDERLEWDRDGQYFHYLTKWMHALDQMARASRQPRLNLWARELAEAAHDAFTYIPAGPAPRRMYWKMSIDLTRPLVLSMGQHDPLDGFITDLELRATAARMPGPVDGPDLTAETDELSGIMAGRDWTTSDPLGIGGLLADAYRVWQLGRQGGGTPAHLFDVLLEAGVAGLRHYARSGEHRLPAESRLAFRELGLAIGLHAVDSMWQEVEQIPRSFSTTPESRAKLRELVRYLPLRDEIEAFWRDPKNRRTTAWSEHRDINEVMLATTLAPDGFLELAVAY